MSNTLSASSIAWTIAAEKSPPKLASLALVRKFHLKGSFRMFPRKCACCDRDIVKGYVLSDGRFLGQACSATTTWGGRVIDGAGAWVGR